MDSAEIRQSFIDFFQNKGHTFVPSAPVVPADDPTLMFTNAGMNQFKEIFLGLSSRSYCRAVNSQKCIRVSGKHNDLEEVGQDTSHHTFFEMLGNWSFGDYYKKEAIQWAWELLTYEWGLPKDKLYATVFRTDDEAEKLWVDETDIVPSHVLRFDEKDNFWEMGEIGPCGPCSEIHMDLGPAACMRSHESDHICKVNGDCGRFIEIWNLVFIQYNRREDGSLVELVHKHIDTGMGFERITAIMQNKTSNYDTDIFLPFIQKVAEFSGKSYDSDPVAFRVIADHIRALTIAIADGVVPSNEGRGYVIRRLLRRASRYGRNLELKEAFLYRIVPQVVAKMGDAFAELHQKEIYVQEVVRAEEESFLLTLEQGMHRFYQLLADSQIQQGKSIPGHEAFRLYDTYGFPEDLTTLMAREEGYDVDHQGFQDALEKQREMGRAQAKGGDNLLKIVQDKQDLPATKFTGYETLTDRGKIQAIIGDGQTEFSDSLDLAEAARQEVWLVTDRTPCYGESGGQVGDTGEVVWQGAQMGELVDCQKREDRTFHKVKITASVGTLRQGDEVEWRVDEALRRWTRSHHTATHALQYALRQTLGPHVSQAGSVVMPQRLRFDFTHYRALSPDELSKIEDIVNDLISQHLPVNKEIMSLDQAQKEGAMAFFGEKYGETVRVINFGESKELCGGTHVDNTAEIQAFRILKESSPGSGTRRIEAVAGPTAVNHLRRADDSVHELAHILNTSPEGIVGAAQQLLIKAQTAKKAKPAASSSLKLEDFEQNKKEWNGYKFFPYHFAVDTPMEEMRQWADRLRQKFSFAIVVFGAQVGQKALLLAAADKEITPQPVDCNLLIKEIAPAVGGGGGGRPDFVQAGGKKPEGIDQALIAAEEYVQKISA